MPRAHKGAREQGGLEVGGPSPVGGITSITNSAARTTYVACCHGWVYIDGDLDPSIHPVCELKACEADAREWLQRHHDRPGSDTAEPALRDTVLEHNTREGAAATANDDTPERHPMPLWQDIDDALLDRLMDVGLVTNGDAPQDVAIETSIDDISDIVPLSPQESADLLRVGFRSSNTLDMPPPPPRLSACILYVGYSAFRGEVSAILLRLCRAGAAGRRLWCTPGGLLEAGESSAHAALRETCEELLSMPASQANEHATHLLTKEGNMLKGPYGSTKRHCAYILCRLLGNVDDLAATFCANEEVDAVRVVPISSIDGSATSLELEGEVLQLRDKIGHMRMQAARDLVAANDSAIGHSPDLTGIVPPSRTTGLLGGARGDRNHDHMLIGARVRKLVRSHAAGPRLILTEYLVIGVDMVQQHAYDVEDPRGARLKTDLARRLMRTPDEPLERHGEWQLLPHQASIEPLHPTAFFCSKCLLQSSRKPCFMCDGPDGAPDHVLLSGQQFNRMAETQQLDASQPQQATMPMTMAMRPRPILSSRSNPEAEGLQSPSKPSLEQVDAVVADAPQPTAMPMSMSMTMRPATADLVFTGSCACRCDCDYGK